MALSDEQISLMAFNDDPGDWNNLAFRDCWINGYKTGARAIETEVRKQNDALIQQMHGALCECAEDSQEQLDRMEAAKLRQYKPQAVAYQEATIDAAKRAITAARARLGEKT